MSRKEAESKGEEGSRAFGSQRSTERSRGANKAKDRAGILEKISSAVETTLS